MHKTIMDVGEVAQYLGFSTKKIYRLAEDRKIPASKVGRQYRFVKKAIDDWLKQMSVYAMDSASLVSKIEHKKKG